MDPRPPRDLHQRWHVRRRDAPAAGRTGQGRPTPGQPRPGRRRHGLPGRHHQPAGALLPGRLDVRQPTRNRSDTLARRRKRPRESLQGNPAEGPAGRQPAGDVRAGAGAGRPVDRAARRSRRARGRQHGVHGGGRAGADSRGRRFERPVLFRKQRAGFFPRRGTARAGPRRRGRGPAADRRGARQVDHARRAERRHLSAGGRVRVVERFGRGGRGRLGSRAGRGPSRAAPRRRRLDPVGRRAAAHATARGADSGGRRQRGCPSSTRPATTTARHWW